MTRPLRPGSQTVTDDASYLYLDVTGQKVARTIEITPTLLVDTSDDGNIVGVEVLGGPVQVHHLVHVLVRARIPREVA